MAKRSKIKAAQGWSNLSVNEKSVNSACTGESRVWSHVVVSQAQWMCACLQKRHGNPPKDFFENTYYF